MVAEASSRGPHELSKLRQQLAELDTALVRVLEERAGVSRAIAAELEPKAASAELSGDQALARLEAELGGALPAESLRRIYREVLAAARSIEQSGPVCYVGPEGGFGALMASGYFGAAVTLVESPTVALALEEVVRGRASYCTFAFESSEDGLMLPAVSALAETSLVIVAEQWAPARFALMRLPGASGPVEKLVATAAAHSACERQVSVELPQVSGVDMRSPVEAAVQAAQDGRVAALVPEVTGAAAGLAVVRDNVGDVPDLEYRHAVVAARPASRSGDDTTCLLFSLDDAPGTLYHVLHHFAERGLNLEKIQSRPARGSSWDYLFYVEIAGHITDRPVLAAVEAVRQSTRYFKVLGSFPSERRSRRARS